MPRTLAQNASYIKDTIKPAIKSAIEAQGVTVPSTDSFLDYADRIAEIEGGGSGYQLKDLPTGAISTVNDAAELPLNALKVSVEAWQEGSGTPSPSNIRPISGWDSATIFDVGKNWFNKTYLSDASNYSNNYSNYNYTDIIKLKPNTTYTISPSSTDKLNNYYYVLRYYVGDGSDITASSSVVYPVNNGTPTTVSFTTGTEGHIRFGAVSSTALSGFMTINYQLEEGNQATTYEPYQGNQYALDFPQTIYGGEWDVVGGRYINSIIYYEKTEVEYYGLYGDDNAPLFYFDVSGIKPYINDGDPVTIISNLYQSYPSLTSELMPNNCIRTRYSVAPTRIYFRDDRFTSKAEINAWLANNPLQVKCELITPTTIDLSPLSIRLLEGTNNLYADCGDIIDGEYFVDEGAIDIRKVDYQIGSSGSIKTTDGRVLSGFASMSGYHARPLDASGNWLDVDWSKDFEVCIAFKYTDSGASGITVLLGYNYNSTLNSRFQSPLIYIDKDHSRDLCLEISSNGSSWMVDQSLSYAISLDTWYVLRLKFTLSTLTLDCSISTDFDTWTSLYNNTLSAAPYHSNTSMIGIGGGCQASAWSSNGLLVDTFNTYIKGDDISWGASTEAFPS